MQGAGVSPAINFRVADAYIALCHHYGWAPSWTGLQAFARGDRERLLSRLEEVSGHDARSAAM